jgi:Protein of unknown function (DUF2800)
MGEHSIFSPSGAHRWFVCPASAHLGEQHRFSSPAMEEGTQAHARLEACLSLGFEPEVEDDTVFFAHRMVKGAMEKSPTLLVEQRLDFSKSVGLDKGAFGTCDVVLLEGGIDEVETIHVIDFKNGREYVPAKDNKQLLFYLLGAAEEHPEAGTYKCSISQPRVSNMLTTWEVSKERLEEFRKEAKRAVKAVVQDGDKEVFGEHCARCPKQVGCKAVESRLLRLKADEFKLEGEVKSKALEKIAIFKPIFEAYQEYAKEELKTKKIKGWGLSEGSKVLSWAAEEAVVRTALEEIAGGRLEGKHLGLKSPAQIKVLLGKEAFDELLIFNPGLVEQKQNKPSLKRTLEKHD